MKICRRIEELLETGPDFNMCIMGALQEGKFGHLFVGPDVNGGCEWCECALASWK